MKRSLKVMAVLAMTATLCTEPVLPALASEQTEGAMKVNSTDFQLKAYMYYNPDLMAEYGTDYDKYYEHYKTYGVFEKRKVAFQSGEEFDEKTLGRFTTIYDESEERATNVKLAAEKINGIVIEPGKTFSFSDTLGSRTEANGYVVAPSFAGGKITSSVGGGICQVSSNLYATMIMAGVQITEHYLHSLPVDYVPRGLDAAIAEGYKDLTFKNNFDFPIIIKAVAKEGKVTVSIQKGEKA